MICAPLLLRRAIVLISAGMATALHVCVPVGAQQIVRADQFAYAIPVILSGSDALNYLDIPQAVYEGAVHADLADLRVVNAGGEPVPHALKPRPGPESAPVPLVDLPYFPLTGSRDIRTDQLEIRTERSKQGTIVRVIPTLHVSGRNFNSAFFQ